MGTNTDLQEHVAKTLLGTLTYWEMTRIPLERLTMKYQGFFHFDPRNV